jgi:rubrerythrin
MSHSSQPRDDAIHAAIEFEERGHTFFKESAARATDGFAREVFEFLAAEELNHLNAIKKFSAANAQGKPADADRIIAELKSGKHQSSIKIIFDKMQGAVPVAGTDLDVYRFAMDFELKGEAMYKKAEAEADDPAAKKLYGFLVGEERHHFNIVESCLAYFENPAEFFHQREKWHMEG